SRRGRGPDVPCPWRGAGIAFACHPTPRPLPPPALPRRTARHGEPGAPRRDLGTAASMTSAAPPAPLVTIDALGRKCPIPIIMLAERIREVPIGQVIAVLADDPAARTDVPSWCAMKSHDFVAATDLPQGWALLIRRRY